MLPAILILLLSAIGIALFIIILLKRRRSTGKAIYNMRVAGLFYRTWQAQLQADGLSEGDSLTLEPEPENPHDVFAVRIMAQNKHIGYVPRRYSREISSLLAKGLGYDALVTHITRFGWPSKIRVRVMIRR
jgi:hypothetical protein